MLSVKKLAGVLVGMVKEKKLAGVKRSPVFRSFFPPPPVSWHNNLHPRAMLTQHGMQ
jgi:hypothetical protein